MSQNHFKKSSSSFSIFFLAIGISILSVGSVAYGFPSLLTGSGSSYNRAGGKSCSNFTGQWNGECQADTGPEKGKFKLFLISIEQHGCSEIVINNETYPIEGTQTLNSSYKERIEGVDIVVSEARTLQSRWSEDRKSIETETIQLSQTLQGPRVSLSKKITTKLTLAGETSLTVQYATPTESLKCSLKIPKL